MKTNVYSLDGKVVKQIELPSIFETEIDSGLIQRAVIAQESASIQPKGVKKNAGRDNTAVYIGMRGKPQRSRTINVGRARLPRMKNRRALLYGRVASVPEAVGGPKAHPPKVNKNSEERINKKEKRMAVRCAVAATADAELVKARGHKIGKDVKLPVVVESKIESLDKTKDVVKLLKALNLYGDVEKAKSKRKIRAGKGKKRGRKYKHAKSVLIVANDSSKIYKAARNLEGMDIISVKDLNAKVLAPGTHPGRLTVWSEAAIGKMT